MQEATILAAQRNDVQLIAPTGSGKTVAFLFSIKERIKENQTGIQAMVIAPSRELAQQIEQVWKKMQTGYKVNCFYGGHSTRREKASLLDPPKLLIGTPGRIAYHIRHENVDPTTLHTLVLDEFDKSLEFGFHQEMEYIVNRLQHLKRRILTSATEVEEIPIFVGLRPEATRLDFSENQEHLPRLIIKAVSTLAADKAETLLRLLCYLGSQSCLVFCNHREAVSRISALLEETGISHGIFHGKLNQEEREKSLLQFKNGTHPILICTDLAARGLDISGIENIIHYQLPSEETFIHRNGRTARMKETGTVFLILNEGVYPDYLVEAPEFLTLPEDSLLPEPSPWTTLYFGAGKKEKINKIDIVGLLHKRGNLQPSEVGIIDVFDHSSYAAVKKEKVKSLLKTLKNVRIKNKIVKIEQVR